MPRRAPAATKPMRKRVPVKETEADTPKRPAHEVLLTELENALHTEPFTAGAESDAWLLLRVLEHSIVPAKSLIYVIRRLESLTTLGRCRTDIDQILATLRGEYQEYVR